MVVHYGLTRLFLTFRNNLLIRLIAYAQPNMWMKKIVNIIGCRKCKQFRLAIQHNVNVLIGVKRKDVGKPNT